MPFEKAAFAVLLVCVTGLGILIAQEASKATAPKSSATKKTTVSSRKKKTARKKTTASSKTSKTSSKTTPATATKKTTTTASTHKSTTASRKRSSKKKSRTAGWRGGQQTPTPARYKEIQEALIAKGYMQAPATGEWGPESVGALKRFQEDQKLEPTGKLDALSLIGLGLGPRNDLSVRSSQSTATPHKEEP